MLWLDSNIQRNKRRGHSNLRPEQHVHKGLSVRGGLLTPALTGAHGQEVGPEMFFCAFQAELSLTLTLLQTHGKTQGTYVET